MVNRHRNQLIILVFITLISIAFYMLYQLDTNILFYQLPSRIERVVAILLVAISIGVSTVIFQTITKNRILTPSIMGLDSVYIFIQTLILFTVGASSPLLTNSQLNYLVSMIILSVFTVVVFKYLFKFTNNKVFLLLLIGIILGTFFGSLSNFLQRLIAPDDFLILQNSMFASFNAINNKLLIITIIIVAILIVIVYKDHRVLDVISLGRENALNLGVNYDKKIGQLLIIVSILVSVSTALVGPIMFLGLLIANLAYETFQTFRHKILLIATSLIGAVALLIGQILTQHVFNNAIEISVLINLIGGIYFIVIMLRESTK